MEFARLVRGRLFTDADDASKPGVAVINQALARKYFAGEDPVGQVLAEAEAAGRFGSVAGAQGAELEFIGRSLGQYDRAALGIQYGHRVVED